MSAARPERCIRSASETCVRWRGCEPRAIIVPVTSDASVALLLFQVAQERNFIHDDWIPAVSSELRRLGVDNDIFETTLSAMADGDHGDGAHDDAAVLDSLADRLRGRYHTLAYTRLWSEAVFRGLHARLPGVVWVYLGDARVAFDGTDHRLAIQQVATLAEIARSAARGRAVDPTALALATVDLSHAQRDANLVRIRVGEQSRPDRPAVVHGSPGCAYGADVRDNPYFANVPFPDDAKIVLKGCSFCGTGGIPRKPAGQVLDSVLAQLDNILQSEPATSRIQINDQNPLPYLIEFVSRATERAQRPLEILIETRADWFLGGLAVFERALAAAERGGHRILLFLVGIENFSQRALDRLNKGATPEQNVRVVEECRRLRRAFPRSYSETRAAFGFILYDPWTELDDLATNAVTCERIQFREFRGQLSRAKLRLYPDTALYYKAKHEGLLAERFPYDAMDSARRYGYEAEVPWRFLHRETDAAYGIHDRIDAIVGKHDDMKVLLEVVRFLQRNPGAVEFPVDEVARDLVRGLGPTFVREIQHQSRA